jgi:alcohol dehydrogenase class IV
MGLATAADSAGAAGEKLVGGLAALNARLAVPRLGGCRGVTHERFDALKAKMAVDALASGSPGNNPVVPTAEQIVSLYDEAY